VVVGAGSSTALLTTAASVSSNLVAMDRAEQLRRLPLAHAVAVRLNEAGADEALIAAALGIEIEGVAPLLVLANAKAARIARSAAARDSGWARISSRGAPDGC